MRKVSHLPSGRDAHLSSGRTNQKLRTRQALLQGARQLMEKGEPVSVTAAARISGISVATAYRYFSDPDTLAGEAVIDLDLARSGDLMAEVSSALEDINDVRERVLRVHRILFEFTRRVEMPYRLFVAKTLETIVKSGGSTKTAVRGGRRISMFKLALEPLRGTLPADKLRDLVFSLSAATGLEVFIVLKDICQLSEKEMDRISENNIRAILDRAMTAT